MTRLFRHVLLRTLPVLLILLVLSFPAQAATGKSSAAEVARDISRECLFNGHPGSSHDLTDGT